MTVKEVFDNTLKHMADMGIADCEASRVTLNSQPITEKVDGKIPAVQLDRVKGYAFTLRFSVMK